VVHPIRELALLSNKFNYLRVNHLLSASNILISWFIVPFPTALRDRSENRAATEQ
jgi:hypothetical protein